MERRTFIKSGTMLSVSAFLSLQLKAFDALPPLAKTNPWDGKRPNPSLFKEPILKAIALGIHAPSPHNTQSWKFQIINDLEMNLYVDENILLPATDPPSRQIHMGAGCFIETLQLGAPRLGYRAVIEYFPKGYDSDKDFGKKPVAHIKMEESEQPASPLAAYIEKRQCNRKVYEGPLVTSEEINAAQALAGKSHSQLKFINQDMDAYLTLFEKAFELESRTYDTNEETRQLFRFSEEERAAKRDGVSIPQMGYKGMIKNIAEKSLNEGDHDTWHSDKSVSLSTKNVNKGIRSSKGILIWYTAQNNYIDWVKAGQDYMRFVLALTSMSLTTHPYNQVIQEYDEMTPLRNQFDELLGIKAPQKVQMVLRVGRADEAYYSYRRNLNDYLTDI